MKKYVGKIMQVDYEKLDDKAFRNLSENVWNAGLYGRGINYAMGLLPTLMVNLLSVAVYGALLGMQNVLLVLAVMLSLSANLYLLNVARKKHRQYFGQIGRHAKRAEYISGQSMDSAAGKDIRIYRMLDLFLKKYDEALEGIGKLYGNIHKWYLLRNLSGAFLEFFRDGVSFGLLVYFLASGRLTAAGFVFCIGAVSRFSLSFEMLLRTVMDFNSVNTTIGYVRDFLGTEESWGEESKVGRERMEEMCKNPVEVTLKDVSFSYPDGRTVLSHVNLTVRPGEKLALIGLNGAGKTTLVKLICGFYQPTDGEILVNGIPVRDYGREEYYRLIAVLFQDSTLLPATLDENLTGLWGEGGQGEPMEPTEPMASREPMEATEPMASREAPEATEPMASREAPEATEPVASREAPEATEPMASREAPEPTEPIEPKQPHAGAGNRLDRNRLERSLALSGFLEKYESLPGKGRTLLGKKLNEGAADFSGGEMQKLLFARALYKAAPLVILDEPTAALDPIAENELYEHYGAAMEGRTSIYISHRLSSTRFCDRIVLLEGGRIVEEGTHESLLAAGGRYTRLYEMQSQYYRDREQIKKRMEAMGDQVSAALETDGGIFDEAG
ncbi:MAG: ATP-binding cassette domain-containing protein [Lachnospiraceae bacterium]|nr:ATP-binding cassette domain-containing protein [Lachnospiraceae bacterium]